MRPLKSKPLTPEASEKVKRRIEAALAKHDRGEPLTEKEELIVYWIRHGGGCHACGGHTGVADVKVVVKLPVERGRELKTLQVRLTKNVRDMGGKTYPEGSVVPVVFAVDDIPQVVGAGYLPLFSGEWEPALTDEDLERLVQGC